jgi:hypothetical protein
MIQNERVCHAPAGHGASRPGKRRALAIIGDRFTLLGWNPRYEQITLGVILLLAVGGAARPRPPLLPLTGSTSGRPS